VKTYDILEVCITTSLIYFLEPAL